MTDTPLFRPQALAAQGENLMGQVVLTLPGLYRLLAVATVAVVVAIIAFMFWGSYSRHQSVRGVVVPASGMVIVQPRSPGFVDQLLAKEGQLVRAGQVILTVNTSLGLADGQVMEVQQLAQLRASLMLVKQAKAQQESFGLAEQQRLGSRMGRLREQVVHFKDELVLEQQQYRLLRRQAEDMEKLVEKGAVSQQDFEAKKLALIDARLRLTRFQRNLLDRENEITELEAERQQQTILQQIKLGGYERELSDLKQRLLELEGRQGYTLTAPVSGRLAVLQVKAGQRVEPGQPVAVVVPEDADYEVELLVPSHAIGLIEEGQAVKLRYEAFPYQRYGLQQGWIRNITGAGLAGRELQTALALPHEPHYRVRVALEKQTVEAFGKQFSLRPRMVVDADIVLDKVPIWYWLLEPVLTLKGAL